MSPITITEKAGYKQRVLNIVEKAGYKKRTLTIAEGMGPAFYVDSVNGSDVNDGLSRATPWLTPDYAAGMLSAGNRLVMIGSSKAPFRYGFAPSVAATFQGLATTDRTYFVGSVDISHGKTIENFIRNGNCEAWLTSTSLWYITQTAGNLIQRSTEHHGGTYGINATRTSATPWLMMYVYLPAATSITLIYWHKEATTTGRWKFYIEEVSTSKFLQSGGNWTVGEYDWDPNDNGTSWHSYSKTFTTNGAGRYQITLFSPYTCTTYLDDISLGFTGISTYQWSDVGGKNYKLLNVPFSLTPNLLAKCTVANWTATGVDALNVVRLVADLATCDATPNSWFYDPTTKLVYYCPVAGEDVTTLHLELTQPKLDISANQVSGVVYPTVSNINFRNINIRYSNSYGYLTPAGETGLKLDFVDSSYAGISCFSINGSSVTANYCSGKYSYAEDIFDVIGTGSLLVGNCLLMEYAYDDGIQSLADGEAVLNYCISRFNGRQMTSDNAGFSAEGNNAKLTLYNCVAYGNYGQGFAHGGTGAGYFTIKNCIGYGTVTDPQYDAQCAVVHSTFTHTNNIFGGHVAAWGLDPTEIIIDPQFVSPPNDLRLQLTSPGINAGVDVGLKNDYLGNPVPKGAVPDIGAYEMA